jgi:hypothetical protein
MTTKSHKSILSILLVIIFGAIASDLYLRLYGIIAGYSADIKAIEWIKIFPRGLQQITAYWIYLFILEALVLAIVIIPIGFVVGIFLKINKIIASVISFAFFFFTKWFYYYNGSFPITSPLIYFLLISVFTIFIFWYSFYLGSRFHNRKRNFSTSDQA